MLPNLCSLFLCALEEQIDTLALCASKATVQHYELTAFAECSVSAASLTAQVTLARPMLFISFVAATHGVPEFI